MYTMLKEFKGLLISIKKGIEANRVDETLEVINEYLDRIEWIIKQ